MYVLEIIINITIFSVFCHIVKKIIITRDIILGPYRPPLAQSIIISLFCSSQSIRCLEPGLVTPRQTDWVSNPSMLHRVQCFQFRCTVLIKNMSHLLPLTPSAEPSDTHKCCEKFTVTDTPMITAAVSPLCEVESPYVHTSYAQVKYTKMSQWSPPSNLYCSGSGLLPSGLIQFGHRITEWGLSDNHFPNDL